MADKEVYVGVEIPARKGLYRALGGLAGSISNREVASLAGRIAETYEITAHAYSPWTGGRIGSERSPSIDKDRTSKREPSRSTEVGTSPVSRNRSIPQFGDSSSK